VVQQGRGCNEFRLRWRMLRAWTPPRADEVGEVSVCEDDVDAALVSADRAEADRRRDAGYGEPRPEGPVAHVDALHVRVRVRGRVELGRDAGPSMSFARQCRCSPRPATKPSCFSVVDVAANGNVLDHCVASETTCGEPTGFRPRKSPAPRDALRQQQRRCESDARPNQKTRQRPEPTVARQVNDP